MARLFLLALLALALPAAAAPKRPASSLGSAKDEDPDFAPAPAPATAPQALACPDDDTALARGLVYAFTPAPLEIRVIAIEDLALLGDSLALNPLAQLIFDAQPAVQAAAIRAVSHFATPRAEEILSNVVRHPVLTDRLKLQAIQALVFQRTPTARELLAKLAASSASNPGLVVGARQALEDWGPPP